MSEDHLFPFGAQPTIEASDELRALADRLNAMADDLEPLLLAPADRRDATRDKRVELRLPQIAGLAELEYRNRRARGRHLASDLLGEPAWDILLDLVVQQARGKLISITSACHASGVPCSTALRWIASLEAHGLISRSGSHYDRRVVYVQLTHQGLMILDRCLLGRETSHTAQT